MWLSHTAELQVRFASTACKKSITERCDWMQSIGNGSALKGAAFWAWYDEGQVGPEGEGGGDGYYGIRDTSSTFDLVRSNAKTISQ